MFWLVKHIETTHLGFHATQKLVSFTLYAKLQSQAVALWCNLKVVKGTTFLKM